MAKTTISFTTDEGEILANLNWLPLAAGDTISFEAPASGANPALFFSPSLIAILTPAPPEPLIVDGTGQPVFTVTAAQPGSYTIVVGSSPEFSPYFPERSSTKLFIESIPVEVGAPYIPPVRSGS